MEASVVHLDAAIVVVDKPSGLPSQSTRTGEEGVYEQLAAKHAYVGLLHRLDQPASGLLVLSVDRRANKPLQTAFSTHAVHRSYVAVLYGHASAGSWTTPVNGKKARTDVEVLGRGKGMTAVRLTLHTGRKHQIRIQAAMAGAPVVGDRRYGGNAGRRWPRLALHAASLEVPHPLDGTRHRFEAALPDDLVQLWTEAGGQLQVGSDVDREGREPG